MASTKQARFRPTVWPGVPIPVPRVDVCPAKVSVPIPVPSVIARRDTFGELGPEEVIEFDASAGGMVELPPDFVLQEVFQADLSTPGLAAFMTRWGALAHTGLRQYDSLPSGQYGSDIGQAQLNEWVAIDNERRYLLRVETARMHVQNLRQLAAHLSVFFEEGDFEDYALAWLSHGHQAPVKDNSGGPGQAWLWFDSLLNAALKPFHAHVDTLYSTSLTVGTPTLYQACALQLYNYLADQVPFARCANETCPHGHDGKAALFTRQRGRAQHGQRRRGARFCTHTCAKSQAERDRRRRVAKEAASGQR